MKLIIIFFSIIFAQLASLGITKLEVTGNDKMQFNVREFTVKAGEGVEIVFRNIGKLPKIAMGHNLVILRKGVSAMSFGNKALKAGANATNALPDSVKDDVLAHSKLLGPGEIEVIKFTAPKEPGNYQYVCTFPGHYSMMRGIMVVK